MKASAVIAILGAGGVVGLLASSFSPFVLFEVLQGTILVALIIAGLRREATIDREERLR